MTQHARVSGRYRLGVQRPNGLLRMRTPWFDNLITDAGLDRLGGFTTDVLTYCQVGSGTAAPTTSDTSLGGLIGATASATTLKGAGSGTPYYGFWRRTYTFASGAATGDVAEVGVGWSAAGGLFSRARVTDLDGAPATVRVLADESLIVVYECRCYTAQQDRSGSIVLDGATHAYTIRACQADMATTGSGAPGWYVPADTGFNMKQFRTACAAYDGPMGPAFDQPTGNEVAISGLQRTADYVPGSYVVSHLLQLPQSAAVLPAGIRSMWVQMGPACYQCEFDPPIPKTALHTLDLEFTIGWGRTA